MRSLGGLEFFILLHCQESTELYSKMLWYYVQRYDEILFIKTSFYIYSRPIEPYVIG